MTATPAEPDLEGIDAAIIAGAYARGLADMLHLLGIPALLVGEAGKILHANRHVPGLLGAAMAITGRQLVFAEPELQVRYAEAIERLSQVRVGSPDNVLVPVPRPDDSPLCLHMIPLRGSDPAVQPVRAVVLLDDGGLGAISFALANLSTADGTPPRAGIAPH